MSASTKKSDDRTSRRVTKTKNTALSLSMRMTGDNDIARCFQNGNAGTGRKANPIEIIDDADVDSGRRATKASKMTSERSSLLPKKRKLIADKQTSMVANSSIATVSATASGNHDQAPAIVTPATPTTLQTLHKSKLRETSVPTHDKSAKAPYIPTNLYKCVHYHQEDMTPLSSTLSKCLALVCQYYHVPSEKEYESDRSLLGGTGHRPLSGMTFEELVVQAYSRGDLRPKLRVEPDSDEEYSVDENNLYVKSHRGMDSCANHKHSATATGAAICTACAKLGHKRWDCPTLI
jgi:hypothetical protein